jgi:hypothetical protein
MCPRVVIKIPQWPGSGVVASFTQGPKSEFVLVILLMTTEAIRFGITEFGGQVALFALNQRMTPRQGKPRFVVVKPIHLPTLVGVATFALWATLTFMFVILFMAAHTLHLSVTVTLDILVARHTFHLGSGMGVAQLKFGLVVLKKWCLPIIGIVTVATFLPKRCHMLIVFFMTGIALLAGLLEHLPFVTLLAFRFCMLAQQRKVRLVMVETGNFFPRLFGVTTSALASQAVLVFVIFDMA